MQAVFGTLDVQLPHRAAAGSIDHGNANTVSFVSCLLFFCLVETHLPQATRQQLRQLQMQVEALQAELDVLKKVSSPPNAPSCPFGCTYLSWVLLWHYLTQGVRLRALLELCPANTPLASE
jgi:hypothetical protein